MVLMHSYDHPLGWLLPVFCLPDALGQAHDSAELMGEKGLLVVFSCNHCPYADAQWPRLVRLAREAEETGVKMVAINSNIHPDYPDDAAEQMPLKAQQLGMHFPYLVDASQQVARDFKAQCTPDPFLFDAGGRLFYHGRIDDNFQSESGVTRQELREAIRALAEGRAAPQPQQASMGCSIKWRDPGCR